MKKVQYIDIAFYSDQVNWNVHKMFNVLRQVDNFLISLKKISVEASKA